MSVVKEMGICRYPCTLTGCGVLLTCNQVLYQTGKYVARAEDIPRASTLSCGQRPIKRAEFEKYTLKYTISYGRRCEDGFFMHANLRGENVLHTQKTNFPVWVKLIY